MSSSNEATTSVWVVRLQRSGESPEKATSETWQEAVEFIFDRLRNAQPAVTRVELRMEWADGDARQAGHVEARDV